eukprot:TRINITY_DN102_c0_g1_i4.p1 TRINITY_DN102_c0_g1~~TRINITY_DN102_c0_g1_i4.p1  ORF type:complete len:414 (+),score=54.56 TRINITY_DN102_c0_g1_i4:146-1387(+)
MCIRDRVSTQSTGETIKRTMFADQQDDQAILDSGRLVIAATVLLEQGSRSPTGGALKDRYHGFFHFLDQLKPEEASAVKPVSDDYFQKTGDADALAQPRRRSHDTMMGKSPRVETIRLGDKGEIEVYLVKEPRGGGKATSMWACKRCIDAGSDLWSCVDGRGNWRKNIQYYTDPENGQLESLHAHFLTHLHADADALELEEWGLLCADLDQILDQCEDLDPAGDTDTDSSAKRPRYRCAGTMPFSHMVRLLHVYKRTRCDPGPPSVPRMVGACKQVVERLHQLGQDESAQILRDDLLLLRSVVAAYPAECSEATREILEQTAHELAKLEILQPPICHGSAGEGVPMSSSMDPPADPELIEVLQRAGLLECLPAFQRANLSLEEVRSMDPATLRELGLTGMQCRRVKRYSNDLD